MVESNFKPKNFRKNACKCDCLKQQFCDSQDGQHVSMCPSYYICNPESEEHENSHFKICGCLECGKKTRVLRTTPYCGKIKPDGHYLQEMDEFGGTRVIGVLCSDCLEILWKKRKLNMAGGGEYFRNAVPSPDFFLVGTWNFKHSENWIELEEDWEDYEEEWSD